MKKWTTEELDMLKQLYPDDSNSQEEMCQKFGRNWEAIKGVAKRYKLKRGNRVETKKWAENDIELLKALYPDISLSQEDISQKMNRTWSSIMNMAHRLELSRENSNYWSKEDNEKLKEIYEDISVSKEQIQKTFPDQSLQSIYNKAFELGLNRQWSEKEIYRLKEIYELESTTDEFLLQELHGRNIHGINSKAGGLGLKRFKEHNPLFWSVKDENKLRLIFDDNNISHQELESIFGRSWDSIRKKAFLIGLKRNEIDTPEKQQFRKERGIKAASLRHSYQKWTDEQIEYLKSAYYKLPQKEICEKLNRQWSAIKIKASQLKLIRRRKKYDVNSNYFEIIDNNIKAYLLGFIMADGNVNGTGMLKIDINKKDIQILKLIQSEIAPEQEIKYPKNRPNSIIFRVNDIYLCNSIKKYGIIPNKSDKIVWPIKLPEQFAIPFIIGYFDGDGTLCISKGENRWVWGILGCYDLLENIRIRIEKHTNITISKPILSGNHYPTYRISKTGNDVKKINDLFEKYQIGLERKRMNKYIKYYNKINSP